MSWGLVIHDVAERFAFRPSNLVVAIHGAEDAMYGNPLLIAGPPVSRRSTPALMRGLYTNRIQQRDGRSIGIGYT